jgi:hypothetical protein
MLQVTHMRSDKVHYYHICIFIETKPTLLLHSFEKIILLETLL